jgi:hypothetical protein
MKINNLFLLSMTNSEKIIRNIDIPSCRNCIYFKPNNYGRFETSLGKCEKFGTKNIITNEIRHDYADFVRNDESKCGITGKYFEEEKNINLKILKHHIIINFPYIVPLLITYILNS